MCLCVAPKFGPFCDQEITDDIVNNTNCNGNGKFEAENTITGCSCRDENGDPTKYHGWHCEIPNLDLCDPDSSERSLHKQLIPNIVLPSIFRFQGITLFISHNIMAV